ncbi:MAG: translesion error-prone DNA polymerase V autoproteolytic subunit [Bacteroidales bacterium]
MKRKVEIFGVDQSKELELFFSETLVKAGFPSPAQDYTELKIDLNRELVRNPDSTFFARVSGESMVNDGVDDGDILVVDRSLTPFDGALAVCAIDNEFTLKRLSIKGKKVILKPANPAFKEIEITEDNLFSIWGVVQYIIKKV